MSQEKCKNKATVVYPWAGKLMEACDAHARAMAMLGNAMGSPIELKAISTENMCMHMDDLNG